MCGVCVGVLWFCGSSILQRPPVSSPFFMEVLVVLTSLLCLSSNFFFFCFSVRVNWEHIISYQYNPDHESGSDSCVTQINITVFFFFF